MSVPHSCSQLASAIEQDKREWIGFRRIGIDASHTERPDNLAWSQKIDVSIKVAAGFNPGPDREARPPRLRTLAESVLHGGVLLALKLKEITDTQILGRQPAQKNRIVFRMPDDVDVIVAGKPLL